VAMRALVRAEHLEPSQEEIDEELETTAKAMNVEADVLRENLVIPTRHVLSREVAKDEGFAVAE